MTLTHNKIVFLVILSFAFIKMVLGMYLPLQADEAYWWTYSRFLDFSYYDQGPGVALHIRLFTSVFGENKFALKLAAVTATSIGNFLVYLISRELGLNFVRSLIALFLSFVLPGFFLGSFIVMHDSSLIAFWLGALYFAIRFLNKQENMSLLAFFVCLGLGALSKHTMIFFVFSVLIWLVFTPKEYKILKNPFLYLGITLAALIVSPILVWNYKHDWVGFEMVLGFHYAAGSKTSSRTLVYIIGQLLVFSPILYILFWVLPFYRGWKYFLSFWNDSVWRFVFLNALILPVSFLLMSTKTTVQPNWTFPSFPAMLITIAALLPNPSNKTKTIIWTTIGLAPGIVFILSILFFHHIKNVVNLDKRFELAHRNFGYREAILEIENFRKHIDPNAKLLANTYQDAARGSWYLPGKPYIPSLNILKRNQFTFWKQPKAKMNYVVYHVSDYPCKKTDFLLLYLDFACDEVIEKPSTVIKKDEKFLKRYQMWYCKNLGEHWNKFFVNQRYEDALKQILENREEFDKFRAKHKVSETTLIQLLNNFGQDLCE